MLLPQLHRLLLVLLVSAAVSGTAQAETLSHGDFSVALPGGFVSEPGGGLLDGQWAGGRHTPSGGGWAIRSLDAATYLDVQQRVAGRIDVTAALSADRFAMLALQEVQDVEGLRTVYVGPADGVDAQVGRWVFTAPAEPTGRRVWWHVYWRTPSSFVELAAWAPAAQLPQLQDDLRRVEALGRPSAPPTETLLFESGQQDCGPPVRLERSVALRQSRRFDDAREVLRAQHDLAPSPTALRLGEHRALGVLYRATEACVHDVARAQRVCSVLEGEARGARAEGLQAAVVACLDGDPKLSEELTREVEAVWSSP